MYLLINDNKYSLTKRLVNRNNIKYINVYPEPSISANDIIYMYSDDEFLLSED